ncbi:hypothetical protein SDC9_121410 [bioreactor metagenome]|uniref:Uncharacterized protein n=1 Tax=bioreactor metagenome TaxID=1076179 RepID=A0A645CC12_9ZZZZ
MGGARQRPAPQRRLPHVVDGGQQPLFVAAHHFGIGQQMVFKGHHLCPLQMGIARHLPRVLVGLRLQRRHKGVDQPHHLGGLGAHVQLHIHVGLVVAAARGVQLFSHVAHPANQVQLHKGVHVLILRPVHQSTGLKILQNAVQARRQGFALLGGQHAALHLHRHMGKAAGDIRLYQPFGVAARAVIVAQQGVLFCLKPPAPQFGFICVCHRGSPHRTFCIIIQ